MKKILILALIAGLSACINTNEESNEESAASAEAPAAQPAASGVAFTGLDGRHVDLSSWPEKWWCLTSGPHGVRPVSAKCLHYSLFITNTRAAPRWSSW